MVNVVVGLWCLWWWVCGDYGGGSVVTVVEGLWLTLVVVGLW